MGLVVAPAIVAANPDVDEDVGSNKIGDFLERVYPEIRCQRHSSIGSSKRISPQELLVVRNKIVLHRSSS